MWKNNFALGLIKQLYIEFMQIYFEQVGNFNIIQSKISDYITLFKKPCYSIIYKACFSIVFDINMRKFVGKKHQKGYRRNRSSTSQILSTESSKKVQKYRGNTTLPRLLCIHQMVWSKRANTACVSSSQRNCYRSDTLQKAKKKNKAIVRSPDADTDFFDIANGVCQERTLALYLLIICRHYVLRTPEAQIKKKWFHI